MLDKETVLNLLDRLGLPSQGKKLVLEARIKAPVRDVASRGGNVITVIASRKMQREIRTESRHIEFQAALRYEHDEGVLEYYPQPCRLKFELVDEVTGEIHTITHFPDFLVLRHDRIELVEWKSLDKLERLASKQPWRYRKEADGRWAAPGIESTLAEAGIHYRIATDNDLVPRWSENMLALEDYFHPGALPCPVEVLTRIRTALDAEPYLYLADLYAEPYQFTPDQVLKAIADGELVADLNREDLSKPTSAKVYRDPAVLELIHGYGGPTQVRETFSYAFPVTSGVAFAFDGVRYIINLVGENALVVTDGQGKQTEVTHDWLHQRHQEGRLVPEVETLPAVQESLSQYTEAELQQALHRQKLLEREDGVSERTFRRWRQRQLVAERNQRNEVLALVPCTRDRGNRTPRLTEEQESLMARIIESQWLSNRAPNYKACYKYLIVACDSAGVDCPSYPTLIERIKRQDVTRSNRARHGKRRAYQEGDFVWVLNVDTPVHGSRPFQYCHIDHTQLDIELICSRTGKKLGRPWFSLAVDSYDRCILSTYLSYDPPSYVSSMMVIRDIVRRHHRLPQFIVVDNGADFRSTNFEGVMHVLGVHLRFRPAGQPRHGAVLERLFGRAHSEYVHNLAGNTKATKQVRTTTGKFLPQRLAEWTLEAMYYGLEHWAFDYYEQEPHPALGLSPREFHARGIASSGARSHMHLMCNTDFLIATCPTVEYGGTRTVDRQRGVKHNHFYYSAPELKDLQLANKKVQVRYDPWDASTVYAEVNKRWVRCFCNNLASLGQLTEAERMLFSEEYKKRHGLKPDAEVSVQRLREFLETFTPEGALAMHRARLTENKALYGGLNQAWVQPPVNATPLGHVNVPAPSSRVDSVAIPSVPLSDDDLPEFDTF